MSDPINRPAHYTAGGIECIDAIEAALTPEEARGFRKGNALKYLWRAGRKGDHTEDIKKARWYIDREIAKGSTVVQDNAHKARLETARTKRVYATQLETMAELADGPIAATALLAGASALRAIADTYSREMSPRQELRLPPLSADKLGRIHDHTPKQRIHPR